jgi:hypothetical protein
MGREAIKEGSDQAWKDEAWQEESKGSHRGHPDHHGFRQRSCHRDEALSRSKRIPTPALL